MNIRNCAVVAALAVLGIAGQASAATFVVNQTLDITGRGKQANYGWDTGDRYGEGGLFQPDVEITLVEGDVLDWTVLFIGTPHYLYVTGPLEITANLNPHGADAVLTRATGTLTLLDYVGGPLASATRTAQLGDGVGNGYYGADFSAVPLGAKFYGFHYVGTLDDLPDGTDQYTVRTSFAFVTGATAVPEPATWAMMIFGFGLVGGALRRRTIVA